jgi:hypothetical protein
LQGDNGDCWLLATLGAIAEWSDRAKLLFRNKNYTEQASKNGVFEVNMWMYGKPMIVVVDDRLLMEKEGRPAMARRSPNGAWWIPILEKSAAKYFGTYESLDAGMFYDAFYAFTGMPSLRVSHKDYTVAKTFSYLNHFNNLSYILSSTSHKD